ncbi:MAG TPA: glycerol-3-phosphate 1-O-acyltransferase PlsY [Ktedonobacteraceae bacterium]|nr:glycerol-3-phosphate 1-O-acyltransferase PlsY [Ktedonobacteraceae bacterium]
MPGVAGSLLLITILSYLWGSLPSGYWMGKLLRGKDYDIRAYGSHKTGATNVQRTLGTIPALIVLILDLSKGIGPALLALYVPIFYGAGWGILLAGLAALLGHCYPVFIGFKGGRGVLTGAGSLLVASPLIFLISAIATFSTMALWRYVSLGSIVGAATTIVFSIAFYFIGQANPAFIGHISLPEMLLLILAPALVIFFHADNIRRLLAGNERKLSFKKAPGPA